MRSSEILELFKEKAALLEGHFELASKKHSTFYLQCALILQYPEYAARLCALLGDYFKKERIDVVVGPAIGGIILAYELARTLGVRAIYAERKEEVLELRRGFELKNGERVLLVEDVITTGGSIRELAFLCEARGAQIVGLASLVDRSQGNFQGSYPFKSLVDIHLPTYEKKECPMCKEGIAVVKPGSQRLVSA